MDFRLILKKIANKLSFSESKQFNHWIKENTEHAKYFKNVQRSIFATEEMEEINLNEEWNRFKQEIENKPKKNNRQLWIAASIAGIFLIGSYFYIYNSTTSDPNISLDKVLVVQNKPILILDDGTQVLLDKKEGFSTDRLQSKGEELIYNQVEILNKDELVYNELIVPRGGNYKLMLSDGTEVYLNSDTKIKYPESFHKDAPRVVELVYGEAYFKVVSMDNKASSSSEFQVKTANQTIHVLGTEFNVANYSEKNQIETTLINGKVSLHSTFEKLELKPGYKAINSNDGYFEVNAVNTDHVKAWINGEYKFKKESLEEIMQRVSYWFDVQVQFESEDLMLLEFSGVFNKKQTLENILNLLKQGNIINYEIKKDKVLIKNTKHPNI